MKIFSLNSINFGKKIPIKECKIIDKKQNKATSATIYEHDCTDLFDAYEIKNADIKDGEVLGICHTSEEKDIEVALLSSKKSGNYKYIGQNILSALAQKTQEQGGEELKISAVLEEAEDYYEKACGFEKRINGVIEPYPTYHLTKANIPKFIEKVRAKTETV